MHSPERNFDLDPSTGDGVAPKEHLADQNAQTSTGLTVRARFRFAVTGIVLPAIALLLCTEDSPLPTSPWQSGEVKDYVSRLLTWPGYAAFLPMLIYSMVSLSLFVFRERSLRMLPVRIGLYGGAVLAIQFLVIVMLVGGGAFTLMFGGITWIALLVTGYPMVLAIQRSKRFTIRFLMTLTAISAIVLVTLQWLVASGKLDSDFAGYFLLAAVGCPPLACVTYCRSAWLAWNWREYEALESHGANRAYTMPSVIGWLFAYAGAWTVSIEIMLREYAKLPIQNPQCYVCSAAAGGHRVVVRSSPVGPQHVPINQQVRRIKALEFAIAVIAPSFHCGLRRAYDRVGPTLAKPCRRSKLVADLTYFSLLPVEAVAVIATRILGVRSDLINAMFTE